MTRVILKYLGAEQCHDIDRGLYVWRLCSKVRAIYPRVYYNVQRDFEIFQGRSKHWLRFTVLQKRHIWGSRLPLVGSTHASESYVNVYSPGTFAIQDPKIILRIYFPRKSLSSNLILYNIAWLLQKARRKKYDTVKGMKEAQQKFRNKMKEKWNKIVKKREMENRGILSRIYQ